MSPQRENGSGQVVPRVLPTPSSAQGLGGNVFDEHLSVFVGA